MPEAHELVGLQRAEFSRAAYVQSIIFIIQIVIAILAGVAVFVSAPLVGYVAGTCTAVLAVVWAWLTWLLENSRSQAERARRATMLIEGLGVNLSPKEMVELRAGFTVSPEAGQLKQDPTFFDSSRPSGEARLADMLEESAFWSGSLMRTCSHRMWAVFIGYFGLAIVLLIVIVEFGKASVAQKIAELFCVVITFLMSTDVLGSARKFGSGASGLETMLPRVEAAKVRGEGRGDLLFIIASLQLDCRGCTGNSRQSLF